jgi:hypothetical protein
MLVALTVVRAVKPLKTPAPSVPSGIAVRLSGRIRLTIFARPGSVPVAKPVTELAERSRATNLFAVFRTS